MNRQWMQFSLGVFAITAFIALGAIVIWFGELRSLFEQRQIYYIYFQNAPGLAPEVPVRRAGIRIGQVRQVEYSEEFALVVATVEIEGDVQLREGDEPSLKVNPLLGNPYIEFSTRPELRGQKGRPLIPKGSVFEGRSPTDLTVATRQAANLVPDLDETILEVRRTAATWTRLGDRLDRMIAVNEEQVQELIADARQSLTQINSLSASLNRIVTPETEADAKILMTNLRQSSEDLQPALESIRHFIQVLDTRSPEVDRLLVNLDRTAQPLADNSDAVMQNLETTLASADRSFAELELILRRINQEDGTIQRLLKDPAFYQNLDNSAFQLARVLTQFEKVLQDLKVFADKIARHPGELGVQGVLTRDSGLKEVEPEHSQRQHPIRRLLP